MTFFAEKVGQAKRGFAVRLEILAIIYFTQTPLVLMPSCAQRSDFIVITTT